jgi:2-phosphoglycerate kinase
MTQRDPESSPAELLVRRGALAIPFSRGILARSLLKLGLDSTRAYDIATRLHDELRAQGITTVTRQHLARVVSERLGAHVGVEIAARYEKLRLFKRSDRPLVLLVGGSTGSGKSSLATEVAHRLDITRILSTDSIRHVMRSMISERLLPSVHRSSFEAWRDASLVCAPGVDPTLAAFLEQVQHVSVAVEAVLERAVQENLSTILEGVHLVPGLFQRFACEPRLQFLQLVVHVEDETAHRQRFVERGRGVATRPGRRYIDNFPAIRVIQGYLVERARSEHLPCIENRDFDAAVHAVLGHVLEGVGDSTPIVLRPATPYS